MKLEDIRREYISKGLTRDDLADDPLKQFEHWMQQACNAEVVDATAMTLATVAKDGQPSQRIVLLKHADKHGFVFYTNLNSHKAQDINNNSKVSLAFAWLSMHRQIIINGTAEQLTAAEVTKYFITRPRDSQLAAWASQQSHPIESRALLEQAFEEMKQKFANGEIPSPDFWGGYRVKPTSIEFWQGRENRLHDRFMYQHSESGCWEVQRLAP